MTGSSRNGQVVLLVDDDPKVLKSYEMTLVSRRFGRVIACPDSREVMSILDTEPVDVILLDLMMPEPSGSDLLPQIVEQYPQIPVIISTAVDDVETAVECIRNGARDYLLKPVERNRFLSTIRRFLELRALQKENDSLKQGLLADSLRNPTAFDAIITRDRAMFSIFKYMEAIADSREPLLITGETGAGKELVANAVHRLSGSAGNFIAVNVAGLDDNMFSDTLFGHRKGAFTDASRERSGLIEEARGGTLFLDEIGDLNTASQVKLLRLLQEKEYYPLGSDKVKRSDCRVVCSTHRPLEELVQTGTFRNDLYFRLRTHRVHIPPLRDRLDDLPLLIDHFVSRAAESMGKEPPPVPIDIVQHLAPYDFPGNVRELRAMIYDAVGSGDFGPLKHIPRQSGRPAPARSGTGPGDAPTDPLEQVRADFSRCRQLPTLEQLGRIAMKEAVKRTGGNVSEAARILGVHRQTAARWLKEK